MLITLSFNIPSFSTVILTTRCKDGNKGLGLSKLIERIVSSFVARQGEGGELEKAIFPALSLVEAVFWTAPDNACDGYGIHYRFCLSPLIFHRSTSDFSANSIFEPLLDSKKPHPIISRATRALVVLATRESMS
jgi:hypothetical protein